MVDKKAPTEQVSDGMELFPIWKEKYAKMGVTPRELYMRQNGLCWLVQKVSSDGEVVIHCTDGKDEAITKHMLNPTIECVDCMMSFTEKVIEGVVDED